jgi:hypothetical protein
VSRSSDEPSGGASAAIGQLRRLDGRPATSGIAFSTDIIREVWLDRFVPIAAAASLLLNNLVCAGEQRRRNGCTERRVARGDIVPEIVAIVHAVANGQPRTPIHRFAADASGLREASPTKRFS